MTPRCCRDTYVIRIEPLNGPLVDGTEVPCSMEWCDNVWTYSEGAWTLRDPLKQMIDRLTASLPVVRERIDMERQQREAREKA